MKKPTAIIFLTLLSGAALAQEPSRPDQNAPNPNLPRFRESVEIHVMDLDVSVTDSHGRQVPDLAKEDFTVLVDKKPYPLDYFTRVQEGTIHAPDLTTASPDRVLAEYRKGPDAYVPRHFLIYFDLGHLSLSGRKRGVEALRDLVTRMGPGDSARVVSFDRRPRTLNEWTTSKETLLVSLDKIESAGVAQSRLMTELQTLRDIDTTANRRSRAILARSYGEQERAEVIKMLRDMNSELSTLTALGGKKSLLFVTGGFDLQPGSAMVQYAIGGFSLSQYDVQNVTPDLQAVVRRANASDVTFYSVDARGLSAEGVSASEDDPLLMRPGVAFFARQDSQAGLVELAQQTGGLALLNSNDVSRGIAQVYEDTSTYYSIGVTLSKVPGGYHSVKVEVSRPGMTVRARRGYAPRSAGERATDVAQAALRSNVEYRAIPVTMMVAPAKKAKKYFQLPIKLNVPASSLTFVPQGETARAVADVYIAAIDDNGNMSEVGHEEAVFTMPKDAPADVQLEYTAALTMRKGNARVAVNIQDRESGKMGTAKADVRVE